MRLGLSHEAACPCGTWNAEYKIEALYRAVNDGGDGGKGNISEKETCRICLDNIDKEDEVGVWCPQCAKPFHVSCLRRTCNHPENPRRTCPACGQWSQMCEDINGDNDYIIQKLFERSSKLSSASSNEVEYTIKRRFVEYRSEKDNTAIMAACTYENALNMIDKLIEHARQHYDNSDNRVREFINAQNSDGETALMFACKKNLLDVTKKLLSAGADVSLTTKKKNTLLMSACLASSDKCATYLFQTEHEHSEAIRRTGNDENDDGVTALMFACSRNLLNFAKVLLDSGADLNHKDNRNTTLLTYACSARSDECARYLLDSYEGVRDTAHCNNDAGVTALMRACVCKHAGTVRKLLQCRARATSDAMDHRKATVLQYACSAKDPDELSTECVTMLLDDLTSRLPHTDVRTHINLPDTDGRAALMVACAFNANVAVETLLARGAKVDIADNKGHTALMYACDALSVECAKALVKKDRSPEHINAVENTETGSTALMIACERESPDIVRTLLDTAAADVLITDKNGETALMYACNKSSVECVKALVEDEENRRTSQHINYMSPSGKTALLIACRHDNSDIVQTLVNAGSNVLAKDPVGQTPLMYACFQSIDGSTTRVLLEHVNTNEGIDAMTYINSVDSKRQMALMHAVASCNHNSVLALLEQDGLNVDISNRDGDRAVDCAMLHKCGPEMVAFLVNAGATAAKEHSIDTDNDVSVAIVHVAARPSESPPYDDRFEDACRILVLCTCWERPPPPEAHKKYMRHFSNLVYSNTDTDIIFKLCQSMLAILAKRRFLTNKTKIKSNLESLLRLSGELKRNPPIPEIDDYVERILFIHKTRLSECITEDIRASLSSECKALLPPLSSFQTPGMATV